MSARQPAYCEHAFRWLAARKISTAPLTGTDYRVVRAVVHAFELYAYTRSEGVLDAIRLMLREMQPSTRSIARELIAHTLDWSDIERLWPRIDPERKS